MNKKFYLGALAVAALGLASCSQDEPAAPKGDNNVETPDASYVAVSIRSTGAASRAAGEGYEEGTETENAITADNTRFYFFAADGSAFDMNLVSPVNGETTATNMVKPVEIKGTTQDGNETGTGVLILGKASEPIKGVVPYSAVCVNNLSDANFTALAGKSLSEVAEALQSFSDDCGTTFVMSSSNWAADNTENGQVTLAGKIKTTIEEANNDPVHFYQERLAVKVRMNKDNQLPKSYTAKNEENAVAKYTLYIGGKKVEDVTLQVTLNDWKLINKATKARTIKALPTDEPFENWNNATYHRSFWAETVLADVELGTTDFDILDTKEWNKGNAVEYTYEHTEFANVPADGKGFKAVADRNSDATAIVVRGTVEYKAEGQETFSTIELCKWAGSYYEASYLKQIVLDAYNGANTTKAELTDVTFVLDSKKNTYTAQVKNVKQNSFSNIQYWQDGKTSYRINIQHATTTDEAPLFGVVRNHIYDYTINAVVGLGVPGNEVEIPEDTQTYLSAEVNVLNWKVVSNNITLQ